MATNGNYSKVVIDGANGQELLSKAIKDAGLKKPIIPTTKEYIDANALFEQNLYKKRIKHMSQIGLDEIVTNCEKRAIGSAGGFGYKSIKLGADISVMDAMILACWGVEQFNTPKRKQRISY